MKELVVISGKGGTGKTSLVASFAVLAENAVLADCDVDAADLHLVLSPEVGELHDFVSGHEAIIRPQACIGCRGCLEACRYGAISLAKHNGRNVCVVDPAACEGCKVCVAMCPEDAIDFPERHCGVWMVSQTRAGPMVHARLGIAADNSGKLVSTVRKEAKRVAKETRRGLILVDGPPGIGCPVIAAIGGASRVLVVTEPTVSGHHDLERTLALARHFRVPASVCVNKWDINPGKTKEIEEAAQASGATLAGRIRYDPGVTEAQMGARTAIETGASCAEDIRSIWTNILSTTTEMETSA